MSRRRRKKKARAEVYLVPQPETHRLAQLNTLDDWMQNEVPAPTRRRGQQCGTATPR